MDTDMGGIAGNKSTNKEYTRTSKSRVHWAVTWEGDKDMAKRCEICGRILSTRYSDKDGVPVKVDFCKEHGEKETK